MTVGTHRLSAEAVRSLASGPTDVATIRLLMAGQRSRHALLLREVLIAARRHPQAYAGAQLSKAVAALDAVQRAAPAAARQVLGYPLVGAWAAHCLRRLRSPRPQDGDVPLWVDLAHLNAVAGAAAVRAGHPVDLDLPTRSGRVVLPGIGRAHLPGSASFGVARLARDDGWLLEGLHSQLALPWPRLFEGGPHLAGSWEPVHVWEFGPPGARLVVVLDDVDPYRDCYRLASAERLSEGDLAPWHQVLAQAWERLCDRHPGFAQELGAQPVVIVPLQPVPGGPGVTATARDSTLAVAMSPPREPLDLAQSLVHEFQHSKLGALLDLLDLVDIDDRRRIYSPWRADPRPIGGVLQAVYAFLAVAMFWVAELRAGHGINRPLTHYILARSRRQLADAIRTLQGSGALTPAGVDFVAELRETVGHLEQFEVPFGLEAYARIVNEHHRIAWRLRNLRVDDQVLDALADALVAGAAPRGIARDARSLPDVSPRYDEQPLDELARHRLAGSTASTRSPRNSGGGRPGDRALLEGDYAAAASCFFAEIAENPDGIAAWAGLAAARGRLGPTPVCRSYARYPELIAQLYVRLLRRAGAGAPGPDTVAAWLAG